MIFVFQDLESINRMVTSVDARKNIGKRLLADETELTASGNEPSVKRVLTSAGFVTRKFENIIEERRTQNP